MKSKRFAIGPVCIASDHAGFALKGFLQSQRRRLNWKDLGPHSLSSFKDGKTDYPLWADRLCKALPPSLAGVLICGSGQGMAMRANRHSHIRAALCWSAKAARLSRQHNHANVLCLGGRLISFQKALDILDAFLAEPCDLSLSHSRRVSMLKGVLP